MLRSGRGITVVIPSYNRRQALLRAIESVEASSLARVEIIVIDDASDMEPPAPLPAINRHGVPVRLLIQDRNRGPQVARNLGIRRARNAVIALLDSDDEFLPGKISILLREFADDRVDLVYHDVVGMERYGRITRWLRRHTPWLDLRWQLALFNPIITPALAFRRQNRLFPPGVRYCEDYAFLLNYVRRGTTEVYVPQSLSRVWRRQGDAGGLSAARWRMRVGEFRARAVLLRGRDTGSPARYLVGAIAGSARMITDLIRGRYL